DAGACPVPAAGPSVSRKRNELAPPRRGHLLFVVTAGVLMVGVVAGIVRWRAATHDASGASVLLVTIDTLRADHVGAYGAKTGATPHLDALAAAGVRFDQVQTAVPLTGPS